MFSGGYKFLSCWTEKTLVSQRPSHWMCNKKIFLLFYLFIYLFSICYYFLLPSLVFISHSNYRHSLSNKLNPPTSQTFCRTLNVKAFQSSLFLAIAEVYKTEGNEAYLKEDYSNAVYFYAEGIKVNCKNEDLKSKLYSNRAYANLRLGEASHLCFSSWGQLYLANTGELAWPASAQRIWFAIRRSYRVWIGRD